MEDKILILPVLKDGVTRLGELYNCIDCESKLENLFDRDLDGDYVYPQPTESNDYQLIHSKSMSEDLNTLKVTGEMKIELLGGLISAEGKANYDNDDKKLLE